MSWLVNTLANSLNLDDDDGNDNNNPDSSPKTHDHPIDSDTSSQPSDQTSTPRGVKDDLYEFSKTLTRNFWGVASFLAPPPNPQIPDHPDQSGGPDQAPDEAARIAGIRNDLSEIGGKFRTEISKLSSNKAVSEFTKIATNLLHFGDDEDWSVEDYAERGVVGVTDEVVAFARDVSVHPETWLDFPLPHDDEDDDDEFDLSDAQQEHALAVERLAPELAALRSELCFGYMTEGSFWKVYFVLVHPRLSKEDAVILSTPPILEARAMLTHDFHNRGKSRQYVAGSSDVSVDRTELSHEERLSVPGLDRSDSVPVEILSVEPASLPDRDVETDKHPIASTEIQVIDKAVVEEVPMKQTVSEKTTTSTSKSIGSVDQSDEDDADDWLKEESTETGSFMGTPYPVGNGDDDDVSFSDLEDDDDVPSVKKTG